MQKSRVTAALSEHKSCSYSLYIDSSYKAVAKCEMCDEFMKLVRCKSSQCGFRTEICTECLVHKSQEPEDNSQSQSGGSTFLYVVIAVIVGFVGIVYILYDSTELHTSPEKSLLGRLRERFPSQKNETWYHILSVLEQKVPTVKSITLLHKNDRRTSDCIVRELVNIFRKDVKIKEVSFDVEGIEFRDYGEVLELYRDVVKRFRVLVTDLDAVPVKISRVFHSLCDEVSSDIKPSLFIFLLRWDEETVNMRPLERATVILKNAWRDLPDSDLFPLLSRVVKNVVDVVPEKGSVC